MRGNKKELELVRNWCYYIILSLRVRLVGGVEK